MKNIVIIVLLFVIGCGAGGKSNSVLVPYFTDIELIESITDTLLVVDSLEKHVDIEKSSAVYILNSKCTSCLGQFNEYCHDMKNMNIPIIAIIHDYSSIMVEYMIDEFVKNKDMTIKLVDNNDTYFKGNINRYNSTVYVINRGEIKNRFKYHSVKK